LDLLEVIARRGEGGVSESARETGLTVPTAHNLMKTLTRRQYLTTRNGRYRLGPATSLLASRFAPTLALPSLVRPMIASAYRDLGHAMFAFVLVGKGIHCIAYGDSTVPVEALPDVWGSKPPLEAAAGRVLVAMLPESEWGPFLDDSAGIEPGWGREAWIADLCSIAETGLCAKCSPERVAAISVPVWGPGGDVLASLSCSLRVEIADATVANRILDRLWALSSELSNDLGCERLPFLRPSLPASFLDVLPDKAAS